MCGACGASTYSDSVLGKQPTFRERILVAQMVTAGCRGIPGAPRITALAEGWSVSGATGSMELCHTVEGIWLAVRDRGGLHLQQALEARVLIEEPDSLGAKVISLGLRMALQRQIDNCQSAQLIGT